MSQAMKVSTLALVAMLWPCQHLRAKDDIPARIAAVKDTFNGAECVVVFDATDVTVAPNGIGTNVRTRVVKILTDTGIRSQSRHVWDFDPATNRFQLNAARIHRKDGKVEEIDIKTAVNQPAPAGIIFWGSRQTLIAIPDLRVGDAIELVHTKTGFNTAYLADGASKTPPDSGGRGAVGSRATGGRAAGSDRPSGEVLPPAPAGGPDGPALEPPMPGHWYDVIIWDEGYPIVEKRYTVRLPRDKPLQYEIVSGEVTSAVQFDGDHTVYRFEKKNIPPFAGEAKMVGGDDVRCKLVMATLPDWHAKARWFYEANEPSFKTDDAIKFKVREVIAGAHDDDEKIRRLNHWVAENIRYVGTCRGAHEGYTTHPVTETFHDRGGVCKDKAGLLVAMLREAGLESYIVMTEAGARVEQTPADQFNHAVTAVRRPDGTLRLLDPTWLPKSREMWSSAEQLQAVVFGTPQGESGLKLSDYSPPVDNATVWNVRSTLTPEGDLRTEFDITTVGAPETALRRAMSGLQPTDRPGRFEECLRILAPQTVLASLEVTDPADYSGPATIQLACTAGEYAYGNADRRYLRLPGMSGVLFDLLLSDVRDSAGVAAKDRRHPLRIRSTRRFACSEFIDLPEGWSTAKLPPAVTLDGPAASMTFNIECRAGRISYDCKLDLKKHIVPVSEYDGYKQVIDALRKIGDEIVVLTQEERHAQR